MTSAAESVIELLPAVDISDGQVVQTASSGGGGPGPDPVEVALRWQSVGAHWLHVVDLDAAFDRGSNADVVAEVVARVDIDVEVSGGVATEETLQAALATGCRRVVLSSAALLTPRWCADVVRRYGELLAVALDVRAATVSPRGSGEEVGPLVDVLEWLEKAGAARYIVTDVARDGTLAGPNLDLLRSVCARTRARVIASGGIASLADLDALAAMAPEGLEGAVLGTALYTGSLDLSAALHRLRALTTGS